MIVLLPLTHTSETVPKNILYKYSKTTVYYSGNTTEELCTILLGYNIISTHHISHTKALQHIKCHGGPYWFNKKPHYQPHNRPTNDVADAYDRFLPIKSDI